MKYSPCLLHSISHFAVRSVTLLRGRDSLLKCISIVHHGFLSESLWLWRKGESDQLESQPDWKQGLLNGERKASDCIAVVVVEGCNGRLLRAKHANLSLKVLFFFYKCIRLEEKKTHGQWTLSVGSNDMSTVLYSDLTVIYLRTN